MRSSSFSSANGSSLAVSWATAQAGAASTSTKKRRFTSLRRDAGAGDVGHVRVAAGETLGALVRVARESAATDRGRLHHLALVRAGVALRDARVVDDVHRAHHGADLGRVELLVFARLRPVDRFVPTV